MPELTVSSPEGASAVLEAGATAGDALTALSSRRGMVLVARVDGELRDLDAPVQDGAVVEPVLVDTEDGRQVLRHSCAHVMAQAVTDLWPGATFAIGPPITDGFYYDFGATEPRITEDDFARIEERMAAIVREDQPFACRRVSIPEARELMADQPYKLEILDLLDREVVGEGGSAAMSVMSVRAVEDETAPAPSTDGTVTVYENRRPDGTVWVDLCRGPHVPPTRWIPAYALERVAGAYWRGDERRPQLQRVYGTAWESRKALKAHHERLAEARKRDHRVLARDLDLLSFPEELGSGLAIWHPKGGIVRSEMEDYSRAEHLRRGYEPVYTPHIGKSALWETSGHLGFYADGMYPPMQLDAGSGDASEGTDYYPKPMNCPFHVLVYRSRTRSYRELPLRLAELGTVYRYERSGTLHGLLRARGFTQDDAHIFCTEDQLVDEVADALRFAIDLLADFGFVEGPSRIALSTRPEKAETVGTEQGWAHAEASLHAALAKVGVEYVVDEGEGAFYGPKIDLQVTDAIGRAWQLSTVQVDFNLPERFGLAYAGSDGAEHRPYMVHRALYGSLDRFFAILLEHYAGAFPLWLAPEQVVVVPVAHAFDGYAREVVDVLRGAGLRAGADLSDEKLGAKIRAHQVGKVPYQLIVGGDEEGARTVAVRPYAGEQRKAVPLDDLVAELAAEVTTRGRTAGVT